MQRRNIWAGGVAALAVVALGGMTALAESNTDVPAASSSVVASPNQQQALDANQTVLNFIQQHPDVTVPPTTPPSTTPPPTTTTVAPPPTTAPPSDNPTTAPPVTTTIAPPPTTTAAPVSQFASGEPWSSGAYTDLDASQATTFASTRGRALDNISVFPQRDTWATLNNSWYLSSSAIPAGFKGDILIAMPLWPANGNVSADYTANWKTFAQQVAAVDPTAIVRLGWENNLPVNENFWAATSANQAQWITTFNKDAVAIHSVAPGLRILYNPNAGGDQTNASSRAIFNGVKNNVWSYGIDLYDWYPGDNGGQNSKIGGAGFLQDSLNFAVANGKPFSIPEWGVSCNTGSSCSAAGNAGGDDPAFIHEVLGFLGTNRANVALESYFNETQGYIGSNLSPTTTNPKSAAQYKADLATLAGSVH
jgi:hypothetical protein